MDKVSIIIPSRNERFLKETVDDVFNKARGEIEVIVILDGYYPDPPLVERPNLILVHKNTPEGLRAADNDGARLATGKYLLKCDAHCMFGEGFDEILKKECDVDWLVVPRRVSLDPINWCIQNTGKSPVDYEYLSYPLFHPEDPGMHGVHWMDRARTRLDIPIDDDMSFQGSCWFMPKDLFWKFGPMDEVGYGTFMQEPQELGLRVWLSGGKQVRNKNTWYAHLHKGKQFGRGYSLEGQNRRNSQRFCIDYWVYNKFPLATRKFEWLIEKFWPVPTWPNNWKDILYNEQDLRIYK